MKIVLSILLLIYISAFTPVIELAKVPELFSHYLEHKAENKQLSFFNFLQLHYSGDSSHTENHHHSLPFKSIYPVTYIALAIPNNINSELANTFQNKAYSLRIFFYQSKYWFQYFQIIWQPPRI